MAETVLAAPRRKRGKRAKGDASAAFAAHARALKLPEPVRELVFAPDRKWRFDFAWPDYMVALEIEGIVVRRHNGATVALGRHTHIAGFKADCVKYATAAVLGWTVLRFEGSQVLDGTAVMFVAQMLERKGWIRDEEAECKRVTSR